MEQVSSGSGECELTIQFIGPPSQCGRLLLLLSLLLWTFHVKINHALTGKLIYISSSSIWRTVREDGCGGGGRRGVVEDVIVAFMCMAATTTTIIILYVCVPPAADVCVDTCVISVGQQYVRGDQFRPALRYNDFRCARCRASSLSLLRTHPRRAPSSLSHRLSSSAPVCDFSPRCYMMRSYPRILTRSHR